MIITIKINKTDLAQYDSMNLWLAKNVGTYASSLKSVNENTPWFVQYDWKCWQYIFYREKDATMFALRWA
jgi:hypothetical protein